MKTLKIFLLGAICAASAVAASAQAAKETFKVSGNCSMCKAKIEKAAKQAGAQTAIWNKDSKEITVTYVSSITNTAKIQQKIADAGYDNEGFTANEKAYNKLDACCQYERKDAVAKSCCSKMGEMSGMKDGKCADMAACKEKGCKDVATCKDKGCSQECKDANGKMDCCKNASGNMNCCKDADGKMDCCKDGKCTKDGHNGSDCCKKS